jgi:hypothetical protein
MVWRGLTSIARRWSNPWSLRPLLCGFFMVLRSILAKTTIVPYSTVTLSYFWLAQERVIGSFVVYCPMLIGMAKLKLMYR